MILRQIISLNLIGESRTVTTLHDVYENSDNVS